MYVLNYFLIAPISHRDSRWRVGLFLFFIKAQRKLGEDDNAFIRCMKVELSRYLHAHLQAQRAIKGGKSKQQDQEARKFQTVDIPMQSSTVFMMWPFVKAVIMPSFLALLR